MDVYQVNSNIRIKKDYFENAYWAMLLLPKCLMLWGRVQVRFPAVPVCEAASLILGQSDSFSAVIWQRDALLRIAYTYAGFYIYYSF